MQHAFVYKRSLRPQEDKLLTVDQVSRRLNCSKSHVYNLVNCGALPALKTGERKGLRIRESEFNIFVEKKESDFGA